MPRDEERIVKVKEALAEAKLDALVCALPTNVLLLSGYWPIVGTSVAIATRDGRVVLLAPEDEKELAQAGGADELEAFEPGSLKELKTAADAISLMLKKRLAKLGVERGRIGYEHGPAHEPASYAAMNIYGAAMGDMIGDAAPSATLEPANATLARLRSILTPAELERVRLACRIAGAAFDAAAKEVRAGVAEIEAAAKARLPLQSPQASRADGYLFCMSGIRSATAYGSFARSTDKRIAAGELVLTHCNSNADGFWTDVTRTFCVGDPIDRQRKMYEAVHAARAAALAAIRPGVRARDVDKAARDALSSRGFGEQFKHATGHGVGFAAIDHNAIPRLHPKSDDVLDIGMVFNIEPAIYVEGKDGMRHCDMVAVTPGGHELLTPFLGEIEDVVLS